MSINRKENSYKEVMIDGTACIEFITGGKIQERVLVDQKPWYEYLHQYHWTAIKKDNRITVVSTINNRPQVRLYRVIVEHENPELDWWGNTIDHRNNNPLDNRQINLEIGNSKFNTTNIKSKFEGENNHLIHKLIRGGYKIHTNVFDETIYKSFDTLEKARAYRDQVVIPYIESRIVDMIKKTRDIEFERGLRDKLNSNEKGEVLEILKKYGITG